MCSLFIQNLNLWRAMISNPNKILTEMPYIMIVYIFLTKFNKLIEDKKVCCDFFQLEAVLANPMLLYTV